MKLFDHSEDGGYATRRSRRDDDKVVIYASPWDIVDDEMDYLDHYIS